MRAFTCILSAACVLGGVLIACSSTKEPPLASDDSTSAGSGNNGGGGPTDPTGAFGTFCVKGSAGVRPQNCFCPFDGGLITGIPCGYAFCENLTNTASICNYDGTLTVLQNFPLSQCSVDGGLPLCADDGGSDDADTDADTDAGSDASDDGG